ncbi:putative mucin/carbohydrate-binding domain-containing protein [Carnobacterium divergens]|nr:putative mucin/carbohydrate-binding domain-containing protein [Carnobacterium divergens]
MKKWILTSLVCLTVLSIGGLQAVAADEAPMQDTVGAEIIPSIEEPTWLFKAGISKGKNHDRQDLGIILEPNATIKIRQEHPDYNGDVTLNLLTNDSKTEKSLKVGSEWVSIKTDVSTVPFIETPYGQTDAMVEYQITGDVKILTVYDKNTTEKDFFEEWDANDGEYALIKGQSFQLFVSKVDKEAVRNLKDFSSIGELVEHYEGIFAQYNKLLGLTSTATDTDKLNQNRYFMKADKNGPGGAYYGSNWTANSETSVSMWLQKNSWGALHEIAHGYQTGFDGKGMYTGEVSNNLYAVDYQYSQYGKEADKVGWLFNYGRKDAVEKELYQALIKDGKGYESINDHRYRLILLTMMQQKAGNESFTKMNQEYRKLASKDGFNAANYQLPDLMNKYYGEVSGYDFTPVFKKWQVSTDEIQGKKNRQNEYQAVASLADVVPESQLTAARALVDPNILINSNFEMVGNQEIAPLGLKGNVHLTLDVQDITDFKGKTILIKEGSKVVKEIKLDSKEITIENMPNGIYTLEIPQGEKARYEFDQQYLYVKEKQNNLAIKFKKIETSNLVNQSIQLLGLGNQQFAELSTNLNDHQAILNISKTTPHSYYKGIKYATIEVRDVNDQIIFTKEIQGTNATVGKEIIPFEVGYKLFIFHDETKNRLKSSEKIIDSSKKENSFIMTQYGLKNNQLGNNPEHQFVEKLSSMLDKIFDDSDNMLLLATKDQLWEAINSLQEPNRTYFLSEYKDILN